MRLPLLIVIIFVCLVALVPALDAEVDEIERELRERVGSSDAEGQGRILAHLAWAAPDNGGTDRHRLAQRARTRLIEYGMHGMPYVREAFEWSDPRFFADILLALIEADKMITAGQSPDSVPGIDTALWSASPDARRLAMMELSRRPIVGLMLPVIDTAYDFPELTPVILDTLVAIRTDRARFFLAEVVEQGNPEYRRQATEVMAQIGGRCLEYLRAWALSDQQELRQIAMEALLPAANIGDLTTLYEYAALFPDDDPNVMNALQARAELLEDIYEKQQQIDSASPSPDD